MPRVLVESRLMREAVVADEVVASTIGLDANESIAYYADRMLFPHFGTPATVRALRGGPWNQATFVVPRRFADGRIGARSKDVRIEVQSAESLTGHAIAVALAVLVSTAAYGFAPARGRRASRGA